MLWLCRSCTALYAVGAPTCPQCGADDHANEGDDMPKTTRHGGASDASTAPVGAVPDGGVGDDAAGPEPVAVKKAAKPRKAAAKRAADD